MTINELTNKVSFLIDKGSVDNTVNKVNDTADKMQKKIDDTEEKIKKNTVNKINQTVKTAHASVNSIMNPLKKLALLLGIGLSLGAMNSLVEEFNDVNDSLESAVGNCEDFDKLQKDILKGANEAKMSYRSMAEAVSGLVRANKELFPTDEAIAFTSEMGKLLKTAGRSEGTVHAVMSLINKDLMTGKINGGTIQMMLRQTPEVINLLAKKLGKTNQQIIEMASKGNLTVKDFKEVILRSTKEIDSQFSKTGMSVSDALMQIRQNWGLWLAQTDKEYQLTERVADMILRIGDIFMKVSDRIIKAIMPLIDDVEDFFAFLEGRPSYIGRELSRAGYNVEELQKSIKSAANTVLELVTNLKLMLAMFVAIKALQGASFLGGLIKEFGSLKDAVQYLWLLKIEPLQIMCKNIQMFAGNIVSAGKAFGGTLLSMGKAAWKFTYECIASLAANPYFWVAVAIVAAAVLIYKYWDKLVPIFKKVWETLGEWCEYAWNKIKSFFSWLGSLPASVASVAKDIAQAFWNYLSSLPDKAAQWGSDLIQNLINGIVSKYEAFKQKIIDLAETVKSFLHFSLPDEGPLAEADKWMPDMVNLLVKGLEAGKEPVEAAASGLSGAIQAGTMNTVYNNSGGNRSVSQSVVFNNQFNGERAAQKNMSSSFNNSAVEATDMLARGLAYTSA